MAIKISKTDLPPGFDLEGHRGCRGLLPENSLPAFLHAISLGVNTLEMDLVVTRDNEVVVSHEPFFSHEISTTPDGKEILPEKESSFNIYRMTYEEVKQFDTGSRPHPRFPVQKNMKVFKPLLKEVIDTAEAYIQTNGLTPVHYNVEIKSTPEGDHHYHPGAAEFSELVYKALEEKQILNRTIIQCFDVRPLQYLRKKYPSLKLSLLVENPLSPEMNLRILGFTPEYYSPSYKLVNPALIRFARSKRMKVLPWTVNDADNFQKLLDLGVDGIITDYPDIIS